MLFCNGNAWILLIGFILIGIFDIGKIEFDFCEFCKGLYNLFDNGKFGNFDNLNNGKFKSLIDLIDWL